MKIINDDILFTHCINQLSADLTILSHEESKIIWDLFEAIAPMIKGGSRIDWNIVSQKKHINDSSQVIVELKKLLKEDVDTSVYILWNDASLPIIKSNLNLVIQTFEDVTRVGFETWLYNPFQGYIVEYYYLGDLNAGIFRT